MYAGIRLYILSGCSEDAFIQDPAAASITISILAYIAGNAGNTVIYCTHFYRFDGLQNTVWTGNSK